ncbi:hypothetical protein [Phenylobacterium sp.]|uniref:hypothetical protein n=1 Tax=Phenylobacterium sp. TaxID=1871053 RepID=UPI0027293E10|nr:hypothetical protein [Phenylobacterium sp.]MDO8379994.1 hypothetical protein [Phenylobacterium sp.]
MPSGLHVLGRRKPQGAEIMATPPPPAEPTARPAMPSLSAEKWRQLAHWQRDPEKGAAIRSLLGKAWNAPNTAIGLGYGLAGYGLGKVMGKNPHIDVRKDSIQFTNNPLGGVGAITLGNAVVFNGNPYDPHDSDGPDWTNDKAMSPLEAARNAEGHELQHVKQGEQLGPLYLPSNLLGGAYSLIRDHQWHGPSNWNERGPGANPPRPWARRPQ